MKPEQLKQNPSLMAIKTCVYSNAAVLLERLNLVQRVLNHSAGR